MRCIFQKKDKQEKDSMVQPHDRDDRKELSSINQKKVVPKDTIKNVDNIEGERSMERSTPISNVEEDKIDQEKNVAGEGKSSSIVKNNGNSVSSGSEEKNVLALNAEHAEIIDEEKTGNDSKILENSSAPEIVDSVAGQSIQPLVVAQGDEDAGASMFKKLAGDIQENAQGIWEEVDGRYVFEGRNGTFKQIPYLSRQDNKNKYHKPDLIADIAQVDSLLLMGASLRGESHYAYESVRQDSFSIEDFKCGRRHYVMASIADGVGNAIYSDQFADLLVNNISVGIKEQLIKCQFIDKIDWNYITNYIWRVSREYCKRKTGSENPTDYYGKWASTLEFVLINAGTENDNEFVHVTICGDGGSYLIRDGEWYAIKNGKKAAGKFISNDVVCLPDKPVNPVIRYGKLKRGEMLFLVTDGLGDCIEESPELRLFLGGKLKASINLSAYVSVICTSIDQMDDDKTGILIKHGGLCYE